MTIEPIEARVTELNEIILKTGNHSDGTEMCAMEAAAWLAGEEWSDHPECVCPIIAQFLRSWNDGMNDDDRQKLKPYVLKVLNTRSTKEIEQRRGLLVADWMIRVYTPTWLNLANLGKEAEALRSLPEIKSWDDVVSAQPRLKGAWAAAWDAAWDAVGDAAWAAARAAAWDAAWDAVGAAAWDAAWAAARDAAWAAARDAARDAAGAAAWAAAWAAAGAAARAAAGAAARAAARAVARAAADQALSRTVERLQVSAFELLNRMMEASENNQ